ncbi:hypothetical protein Francci3_2732 [Frankia casuarinae]|uniref:Uncharacterized protein n=1 Tax=Frankia casuarinae (strain DSM 45818 / CECT 9043 / HFP020203 / CcI3) TaxID=106370 RepID=Q2J9F0_FRACC|nr:hypothetical protein Francci3_2732 [Frankia casuarinae]
MVGTCRSRTNADDRLPADPPGRAEGRDGIVESCDAADVRPQPSIPPPIPRPPDDLTQLGTIGHDNKADGQATHPQGQQEAPDRSRCHPPTPMKSGSDGTVRPRISSLRANGRVRNSAGAADQTQRGVRIETRSTAAPPWPAGVESGRWSRRARDSSLRTGGLQETRPDAGVTQHQDRRISQGSDISALPVN